MLEEQIKNKIRLDLGLRPDIKLFANPCGNGFMGQESANSRDGSILLKNARRLKFGLAVGSSDLIGWCTINGIAVFLALEVKTDKGKPTQEQINFIKAVRACGGIGGIVRSTQDVIALIDHYKSGQALPEIA